MLNLTDATVRIGLSSRLLAILISLATPFPLVSGSETDVTPRTRVSEGLQHYSAGRFSEAAQAFEQAAAASPVDSAESMILRYDHACALRAAGEMDKARKLFLEVSLSDNRSLASSSLYNLANISANEGRQMLGEDPLAVSPEQRAKALERLRTAELNYRDSLRRNPENQDSRHNLELVRLFIKYLQEGWTEYDLQQLRDQKNLFQFLIYLDQQQSQLRDRTRKHLSRGLRISRLERATLAEQQRKLLAEIGPLRTKIDQSLEPMRTTDPPTVNPSIATQSTFPSAEEQAARQQVKQIMDDLSASSERSIAAAADSIEAGNLADALKEQLSVLDRFYETFTALGPFEQVLQRAIDDQQSLIDRQQKIADATLSAVPATDSDASSGGPGVAASGAEEQSQADFQAMAWRQEWITKLSDALSLKAAAILQVMPDDTEAGQLNLQRPSGWDTEPEAPTSDPPSADDPPAFTDDEFNKDDSGDLSNSVERPKPDGVPPMPNQTRSKDEVTKNSNKVDLQALRDALDKAIELSPVIVEHSKSASQALDQRQLQQAEPEQREVLRLLKEIADRLPQPPPEDQPPTEDQQSQQDQGEKNSRDQNQQAQNSKDQQTESESSEQQPSPKSNKTSDERSKPDNSPPADQQPPQSDTKQDQKGKDPQGEQQDQQDPDQQNSADDKQPPPSGQKPSSDSQAAAERQTEGSTSAAKQFELAQKAAQERAQVMLRRIREREAKYRDLLEQLRELQERRSPVDKDW